MVNQGMSHEGSTSRYSAFDKIRQEELRGGDLGWSAEITGTSGLTNEKATLWPIANQRSGRQDSEDQGHNLLLASIFKH